MMSFFNNVYLKSPLLSRTLSVYMLCKVCSYYIGGLNCFPSSAHLETTEEPSACRPVTDLSSVVRAF